MTYRCGSPVPGRAAVLSEKETCSYLYIFSHDPSLPAITNSSPKSNELLERFGPGLQHFLLLPNSWKSSQSTVPAHLPLRPPLGGRSGPHPPWGTHTSVWDAAIGKWKKRGQRRDHGSSNRILCPVPRARRALQERQSSREERSLQHQCSCLPQGHS